MILITCPSEPLVVVIFVDLAHLNRYSTVDVVAFLLVILLTYSFPHIKFCVPWFFQFVQVILKVPSCIKDLILDVFMSPRQ